MLFNSWEFGALVVLLVPLYYLPVPANWRRSWQVTLLLAGSAVFYGWQDSRLLWLLLASCVGNAIAVRRIIHWKGKVEEKGFGGGMEHRSRRWMQGAVIGNLLALVFFKYAGFFAGFLPETLVSETQKQWLGDIPLPVGISFYTFQGISLVVDTWRGTLPRRVCEGLAGTRRKGLSTLRDLSFYIGFFPQLVAGPIVKARDFVGQIGAKSWRDVDGSLVRGCLIGGYFLKIFVADNLAEHTAALTLGPEIIEDMGPLILLSLLYGYSLQIFADFAGYSLIAIGLGALFGYRLPDNFCFPYLASSVTEFWRRWHLTLSAWLRDYVYIPLGGNRTGRGRTYFNLLLVMFLGGLWHGASIKFIIWGLLHGLFLVIERVLIRRKARIDSSMGGGNLDRFRRVVGWCYAFNTVTFLWLAFLMPDLASIMAFLRGLGAPVAFSGAPVFALGFFGSAVGFYHLWGWLREHRLRWVNWIETPGWRGAAHGLMVFLVLTNPGAPRGFIYFQF